MQTFEDAAGREWVASAREEQTPRHHTRWYLVFHPAGQESRVFAMREVRWQTEETADRTVGSMSVFELRKRLQTALNRQGGTEAVSASS